MKIAAVLCGISLACAVAVSAQAAAQYPSFSNQNASRSGFGTNAKVALEWHWSEGNIRSVGVKKVAHGGKGVLCIQPTPALNFRGIFPMVTVANDISNTLTPIAYVRNEADLCPNENYIEVDTFQLNSSGKEAASNSVGFFLIVE